METCKKQFVQCKHVCMKRCHSSDPCNESECIVGIKIFCKCGSINKVIKCGDYKKIEDNENYKFDCNDECKRKERLKKIEIAFEGLLKYNEEKLISDGVMTQEQLDQTPLTQYQDIKFDRFFINYAKKYLKSLIDVEGVIEKALKNQTKTFKIQCFDKNDYIFLLENLSSK